MNDSRIPLGNCLICGDCVCRKAISQRCTSSDGGLNLLLPLGVVSVGVDGEKGAVGCHKFKEYTSFNSPAFPTDSNTV